MRNPIGIAPLNSAIGYARKPKVQAEWLMKHVDAGVGYIYISHTRPDRSSPAEAKPALKFIRATCPGFAKREGLFATGNVESCINYADTSLEVMSIIKGQLPEDVPLIAQISAPTNDLNAWAEHAKEFESAGADMIDLDVSCPITVVSSDELEGAVSSKNLMGVSNLEVETMVKMGLAPCIGDTPEVLGPIVKTVVDAVKVPVGVKPSAEAGFPKCVVLAKICAENGADYVSNINSPITVAPPKIYERGRSPWESVNLKINPIAAAIGPWDRYQCYKSTATIALYVPEIDVKAIGGIVNPEHVVEMLMLGAKKVGLSSGFFWKGRKLITQSINFLNDFMDREGYETVDDLVGIGLQYVQQVDESIVWEEDKITAKVNKSKCTQCGTCMDFYWPVPVEGDDSFPVIDEVNCQGCGMCVAICPGNALSIERIG
jgi:dihydroorotate dehydrogenase/Pyruvate/2-oxoacid:ferredoxin oxidoreductase delta subunit